MIDRPYDKEVLEDGLVIFRIKSTAREHIDIWFQDVASVFAHAHEKHMPVRLLYDIRNIDLVTPYGVQKAEELNKLPLSADWRVATLVKNAFVANLVNYVKLVSLVPEVRDKSRVFSDEPEALAWLRLP